MRFPGFDDEWKRKKIKDLLNLGSGKDYKHLQKGDIPVYGTGGYMTSVNQCLHNGETVCIGRKGTINKPFYHKGEIWTVDTLFYTHSFNGLTPRFGFNIFEKINWLQYNEASGVPSLSKSTIENIEVDIPKEEEQKKIAAFLEKIEERIETQNKIIEELKLLKSTLRKKIFSKQLKFKDDGGKDFPVWKIKKLVEVCDIIGGGTPETNRSEYWNGNILWFTPTEIKTNFVSKSERKITELGLKNSSAKVLPRGAILLTTRATIGEASIAIHECTTNQGFQSLVVKEDCDNVFLFNWIKEHKYELTKRANGSTFSEISKSEIEKIEILTPSFLEQKKIANFLSCIDEKINANEKIYESLNNQKQYLLSNLFI